MEDFYELSDREQDIYDKREQEDIVGYFADGTPARYNRELCERAS